SFAQPEPDDALWGCDITGLEELADKAKQVYRRYLPERNTLTDFDERDLVRYAQAAGFTDLRLDYRAHIGPEPLHADWSPFRRPPVPLAQQRHRGRNEQAADHGGVDEHGHGQPEAHLLDGAHLCRREAAEHDHHQQRRGCDDPPGVLQPPAGRGVAVVAAQDVLPDPAQ